MSDNKNKLSIHATDPDNKKMIKNQLIILLHSVKCVKSREDSQQSCSIPHCKKMKNVLVHWKNACSGRNCPVEHCASSRLLLGHWKQCKSLDCDICEPIVGAWRTKVTKGVRDQLVKKLVCANFPRRGSKEEKSDKDGLEKFYKVAIKNEEIFNGARSQSEYNRMLAERIYKLQKETEASLEKENKDKNEHPIFGNQKLWHENKGTAGEDDKFGNEIEGTHQN